MLYAHTLLINLVKRPSELSYIPNNVHGMARSFRGIKGGSYDASRASANHSLTRQTGPLAWLPITHDDQSADEPARAALQARGALPFRSPSTPRGSNLEVACHS